MIELYIGIWRLYFALCILHYRPERNDTAYVVARLSYGCHLISIDVSRVDRGFRFSLHFPFVYIANDVVEKDGRPVVTGKVFGITLPPKVRK